MCETGGAGWVKNFFCQKDPPLAGGGWGRDFPGNSSSKLQQAKWIATSHNSWNYIQRVLEFYVS